MNFPSRNTNTKAWMYNTWNRKMSHYKVAVRDLEKLLSFFNVINKGGTAALAIHQQPAHKVTCNNQILLVKDVCAIIFLK